MEQKKYKVDIEIYKDFKDVNIYGDGLNYAEMGGTHNGCQSNDFSKNKDVKQICLKIADLFRELIDVNVAKDIDFTTQTDNSAVNDITPSENNKLLYDFIIFLMLKGMVNTKYELPEKVIDHFLHPDKYDLIEF